MASTGFSGRNFKPHGIVARKHPSYFAASVSPDYLSSSFTQDSITTSFDLEDHDTEMDHIGRFNGGTTEPRGQPWRATNRSSASLPEGRKRDNLASLEHERNRVEKLRVRIWSLRSTIHEKRRALRKLQYAKSDADDKYIQQARLHEVSATSGSQLIRKEQERIKKLLAECERIRDEYGPLEDECNMLEDELSRHEFELSKSEAVIYQILNDKDSPVHDDTKSRSETYTQPRLGILEDQGASYKDLRQKSLDEGFTDVDSDTSEHLHPLVTKFLSKMGDVDILRERIGWNMEQKDNLDEDYSLRQLLGKSLSPEDEEWLEEYEQTQIALNKELEVAEGEAKLLRQDCLLQGLIDNDDEPTDLATQEQFAFSKEKDVDTRNQASEYVKFPALLLRPLIPERKMHEKAPNSDEISENTGDRINRWLLHKLRYSPLDVHLLASTFDIKYGEKQEDWQLNVLEVWFNDGAKKSSSDYEVHSSSPSTTKSDPTPRIRPAILLESKFVIPEAMQPSLLRSPILPTSRSDGADTEITCTYTLESQEE